MDKSDKTASLHKRLNRNIWKVFKGKNPKYVVVCGHVFFMAGCMSVDS
jgi:hypothetical protein